jgi:glutathione peroxidase
MALRRKLKRSLFVTAVLTVVFLIYVEIVNRNSVQMSYRQKVMKAIYPALMWFNKLKGGQTKLQETKELPPVPFHDLGLTLNNGDTLSLASAKGKKVLLVNTASACGYTNQYAELQQLWEQYRDRLLVIGFPANDFKEQEKGDDEEIAQFCQLNFGVNFPLSKKTTVIPGDQQHPVYEWLTDKSRNGWNEQAPGWNFSKYLVDEEGRLLGYFEAGVSPLSETIKELIEK